jgi:hypothetical protein
MGSAKDVAAQRLDLRGEAVRFLVKKGIVQVCRHDELVGYDTSKRDMAFAMAQIELTNGTIDAPREGFFAAIGAVLAEAKGRFCASCDKERHEA